MAQRRLRERRDRALGRLEIGLDRRADARDDHALLAEPLGRVAGELERVDLAQRRFVAARSRSGRRARARRAAPPSDRPRLDHLHVAGRRILELVAARERLRKAGDRRERRPEVVARERDEPGERGVVRSAGRLVRSRSICDPRLLAQDLQASAPEVPIGLSRAGVSRRQQGDPDLRWGSGEKLIAADDRLHRRPRSGAEGRPHVALPRAVRGGDRGGRARGGAASSRTSRSTSRTHIVERQQALRAEVRITARYPRERRTPVTELPTQEVVSLIGIAAASERGARRLVGVEATRDQRLPVRAGARPRPRSRAAARGRLRGSRRRADPRARPARDPQPARDRARSSSGTTNGAERRASSSRSSSAR